MKVFVFATAMTVVGLTGLYLKIEYSGWVLFVGLISSASSA